MSSTSVLHVVVPLQNYLAVDPGKVVHGYVPVWMIHQTARTFKV